MKKIIQLFVLVLLVNSVFAQQKSTRVDKNAYAKMGPEYFAVNQVLQYVNAPFLPGFTNGFYTIGPEIMTKLTGWYDYQTNGDCRHQLLMDPANPLLLHAILMASDSIDPGGATSRRTKYAGSTDGGTTWSFITDVPSIRSGFGYMDLNSTGSAVVVNHNTASTVLNGELYIDAYPHLGSFATYLTPTTNGTAIWPQANVMTNGNVFLAAESYAGAAATDTLKIARFNGSNSTAWLYLSYPGPTNNMRWCSAAGASGNVFVAMNPVSIIQMLGAQIVSGYKSTDNGVTFGSAIDLVVPYVQATDTVAPFFGQDLGFKPGTTDYYFAYNTNSGLYKSSALWVCKNAGTPRKIADSNNVPNSATLPSWAGIIGIDHPSIGWSSDGNVMYCAYSVATSDTGLRGWNTRDIFLSCSTNDGVNWLAPIRITNTPLIDEGYVSIARKNPGNSPLTYAVHMAYMKDPGDGPSSFNGTGTLMPATRNWLIYRKISQPTVGINVISSEVPSKYSLLQNYPNPFNPATSIRFSLPKVSDVTIKIFNVNGQLVDVLVNNERVMAGTHETKFNGTNFASGIYFFSITAGDFKDTKKMMLIK